MALPGPLSHRAWPDVHEDQERAMISRKARSTLVESCWRGLGKYANSIPGRRNCRGRDLGVGSSQLTCRGQDSPVSGA